MRSRITLEAADARTMMLAARTEAERSGLPVSIAIVDDAGLLLVLERLDGARLHTPEVATLKARTAALVRESTEALQAQVRTEPALLAFPGRLPLAGGLPISVDGTVVGGVGCSGGAPADDEAVCHAALSALPSTA